MSHLVVAHDGTTNEIHVKPLSRGRLFNSFDCLSYETFMSKSKKHLSESSRGFPADPWGHHITKPPNFITIHFRINFASPRDPYLPPKKKKTWVALNDPRVLTITTSQNNIWETFKTLYNILLNWLVHRDPEIIGLWNNPQYKLGYINDALEYIPKIPTVFAYCSHEPTWMSRLEVSKKVRKQVIITPINPKKKTSRWKKPIDPSPNHWSIRPLPSQDIHPNQRIHSLISCIFFGASAVASSSVALAACAACRCLLRETKYG